MNMAVTEVMDAVGHAWPGAHTDAQRMSGLAAGTHEIAGVENLGAPFCMTIEAEAMGATVELGTREMEPRVAAYAMDHVAEIDRLGSFDPTSGRAAVAVRATSLMSAARPDLPVIADLAGPVSLATSLVEPLAFYRSMRLDKDAAHALLKVCVEAAIAFGDAMVVAGADVVCIADPSATGELIGGKAFAEFALPYINGIVRHFASAGVPSIVHICGDVRSLGGSLGQVVAPIISVDSTVAISALRRLASEHLTMGNVSTYLLEFGTPRKLFDVGRRRVAAGVDVLSPACGIGARTPVANIRALARSVHAEVPPKEECAYERVFA